MTAPSAYPEVMPLGSFAASASAMVCRSSRMVVMPVGRNRAGGFDVGNEGGSDEIHDLDPFEPAVARAVGDADRSAEGGVQAMQPEAERETGRVGRADRFGRAGRSGAGSRGVRAQW